MEIIYEVREFAVRDMGENMYELKGYFKGDNAKGQYLKAITVMKQVLRFRFKPFFRVNDQTALVVGRFV